MGLWASDCGFPLPSQHYRARNWIQAGVQVDNPFKGCIVVWRNHVALFSEWHGGKIQALGGNQSDCVTIAPFTKEGLLGFRYLG